MPRKEDPLSMDTLSASGAVIDGASIPRVAWPIIGGPFEGKYRPASVIHDVACDVRLRPWETVHEVFCTAMLAGGVSRQKAKVMYAAVYHFGPRWPLELHLTGSGVSLVNGREFKSRITEALDAGIVAPSFGPRKDINRRYTVSGNILLRKNLQRNEVAVTLKPKRRTLPVDQFDVLRGAIERDELDLAQIRNFTMRPNGAIFATAK